MKNIFKIPSVMISTACGLVLLTCVVRAEVSQLNQTESGDLDSDGDKLTDAWERGYGRYQFITGNFSWSEAKADAEAKGGHLMTITSDAERQAITLVLGENVRNGWIGATDQENEGQWTWVTGEFWTYQAWASGEPNNGAPRSGVQEDWGHTGWVNTHLTEWNDAADVARSGGTVGYFLEIGYPTDPLKADTDDDGFDDKIESDNGSDPNDPASTPLLTDQDNDGVIYNREITDGTNPNDATSFNPLSVGLVAYYPFNGNANDESGYGNDGTIIGAMLTEDRIRPTSGAYAFDGIDDFITANDSSLPSGNAPRTMSVWVRSTGWVPDNAHILNYGTLNNGTAFGFWHRDNIVSFYGGAFGDVGLQGAGLADDTWEHLLVSYAADSVRVYRNGRFVIEEPRVLSTLLNLLVIGTTPNTDPSHSFTGAIDDIRIYNRALTEAEIGLLYYAEAFSLFTQNEYESFGALQFSNGQRSVTTSPAAYNLFTQSQFDNNRIIGQSDVTTSPSTFSLFTQNQVAESYTQGQNSVLQSIPSVDFSVPASTPFRVTLSGQNVIGVVVDDTESPLPDNWRLDEQAGQLIGSVVGSNSISVVLEGEMAGDAPAIRIPLTFYPQAGQTIAPFARIPTQAFSLAPLTVTPPAASSGFAVVLSVKSGPATIVDNQVTFTGVGKVVLAANQVGNKDMKAAPEVTTSFLVTKGRQNMSFPPLNSMPFVQGGTFQLSAATTSALPVAYSSSNPRVISISGSTATIVGRGRATIRAAQPGDSNWAPATPISRATRIY